MRPSIELWPRRVTLLPAPLVREVIVLRPDEMSASPCSPSSLRWSGPKSERPPPVCTGWQGSGFEPEQALRGWGWREPPASRSGDEVTACES